MTVEQLRELDDLMQKKVVSDRVARDYIGKTMLSRDGSEKGIVTGVSSRHCAACGCNYPCFLVTWPDGKKTKPCTAGVKYAPALQIR